MKIRFRLPALALAVVIGISVAALQHGPVADACGWSEYTSPESPHHPDLPQDGFAAGALGVLQPGYARSYLVVAYRHLAGVGMNAEEQQGALALWDARLKTGGAEPANPEPWQKARQEVLPGPAPTIVPTFQHRYATVDNCLSDAFETAAQTLRARVQQFGPTSREVREWVAGQDAVFASCTGQHVPPPPLTSPHPLLVADRAYQQASALFYAGHFAEAEATFRAIAADSKSPWKSMARYLAVRTITRQAAFAGPGHDKNRLLQARREMEALLADSSSAAMHPAARTYLQLIRYRLEPAVLQRELSIRLGRDRLGPDMRQALDDYTRLVDANAAPLALDAPDDDRLAAWIGVVQSTEAAAFDRAHRLDQQTGSAAWLVATLMKATPAHRARLQPLIEAAAALTPVSPACATARYHRLRLLLGQLPAATLHAEATQVLAQLGPAYGHSTRNAFVSLALRTAPSLEALLAHVRIIPAGTVADDQALVRPIDPPQPRLSPEGAAVLSSRLPLSVMARAAQSNALPDADRAPLVMAVWVRAILLGQTATAQAMVPLLSKLQPAAMPYVQQAMAAKTRDEQRLGLLYFLLRMPGASPSLGPWQHGAVAERAIASSYDTMWWCGSPLQVGPSTGGPGPGAAEVGFLTASERRARDQELRRLQSLGAGATFLAEEASQLAVRLPKDRRIPEALHLAVRATRYGCKDSATTAASRRAFQLLHSRYPNSAWAKSTPYYY